MVKERKYDPVTRKNTLRLIKEQKIRKTIENHLEEKKILMDLNLFCKKYFNKHLEIFSGWCMLMATD